MASWRAPMPAAAAALGCWLLVAAALCGSAMAGPHKTANTLRAGSRASGSGRRALLESSPCAQPAVFTSACSYPISLRVVGQLGAEVAAGFCDNGATAVDQWCSRSLSLSPGASLEVLKNQNQNLYWLASTSRDDADFLRWDGAGRAASLWLDSATAEQCHGSGDTCYHFIEADTGESCTDPFTVTLACDANAMWTPQSCPPAPVAVTSACAHKIDLSVRVKLAEAVGPGYCANAATQVGEWCTRQWFGVDPSEATTLEIYTNNSLVYYYGALHDDASYTWSGTDDGWEAKRYSLASGQPCSEGESQCVAFRLLDFPSAGCASRWDIGTLSCDNYDGQSPSPAAATTIPPSSSPPSSPPPLSLPPSSPPPSSPPPSSPPPSSPLPSSPPPSSPPPLRPPPSSPPPSSLLAPSTVRSAPPAPPPAPLLPSSSKSMSVGLIAGIAGGAGVALAAVAASATVLFIRKRRAAGAGLPTTMSSGAGGGPYKPPPATSAAAICASSGGAPGHASELDSFVVHCLPEEARHGASVDSFVSVPPMGGLGSVPSPGANLDSFVSQPSVAGLDSFPVRVR